MSASIVIPTTMQRESLAPVVEAAVAAVAGMPDGEVVVVANGPADGRRAFELRSPRLRVVESPHRWTPAARNLGLVEMVRRRCSFIVVVDAGADPNYQFDDLANAVRRIRIDLGVQIELDDIDMSLARQGAGNPHCLVGTIRYDAAQENGPRSRSWSRNTARAPVRTAVSTSMAVNPNDPSPIRAKTGRPPPASAAATANGVPTPRHPRGPGSSQVGARRATRAKDRMSPPSATTTESGVITSFRAAMSV